MLNTRKSRSITIKGSDIIQLPYRKEKSKPKPEEIKLAVCVLPVHLYSDLAQLVFWLEFSQIQGVKKFYMFQNLGSDMYSLHKTMKPCLNKFQIFPGISILQHQVWLMRSNITKTEILSNWLSGPSYQVYRSKLYFVIPKWIFFSKPRWRKPQWQHLQAGSLFGLERLCI